MVPRPQHGAFQLVQCGARPFEEHAPHIGERNVPGGAVQQARTKNGLELFDAPAERGLGKVQVVCGRAKAGAFSHRDESLQFLEVETNACHASNYIKNAIY